MEQHRVSDVTSTASADKERNDKHDNVWLAQKRIVLVPGRVSDAEEKRRKETSGYLYNIRSGDAPGKRGTAG